MARFLHPVNSSKKVVDSSGKTVISTVSVSDLADVGTGAAWVDAADVKVPVGCHIHSMYLSVFVVIDESTQAATPLVDWFVCKNLGNNLTFPEPGATGGNDNRRYILHEEKGLTADVGGSGAPMIFRGVIKIPKHLSRFGLQDKFQFRLLTENHVAYFCVKAIYKFYR